MRRTRFFAAALAAAAAFALASPVRAAGPLDEATVLLTFGFTRSATTANTTPQSVACPVTVPATGNGVDMLNEAVANGCVASVTIDPTAFGSYLRCVANVCEQALPSNVADWFWGIHLFGVPTPFGLDDMPAVTGLAYQFTYEPFPCVGFPCP